MGPSRTDYSRKIDYTAIKDGKRQLKAAVLRLVTGIRGKRKNPIHLLDILSWFGTMNIDLVTEALLELKKEDAIISVPGGYRIKTFGDVMNKYSGVAELAPISAVIADFAKKRQGAPRKVKLQPKSETQVLVTKFLNGKHMKAVDERSSPDDFSTLADFYARK